MDYSYRAMHAAVAASGDRLTTREFTTIEHQVISAVEVSDYKKVRQGTYYTLVDGRIVRKFQSESGSVEYELVDTIPENRWRPKKPEKSWLERSMDDAKEMGGKIAKEAFDFLIWDDAKTVMDPRATQQEKEIAAASLMPQGKVFKLFKAGEGALKFANKGKHTAKKVKETAKTSSKKNSVPNWLKERWEAGNKFNKENRPRYPYNEVELEAKKTGGKKYVVDSYKPSREIVSRKYTQLSEVQEKTAKSYLNEIIKKYSSGSKISNGTFNPNALKGGRLKGELILEVPVQTKAIPQKILDEATKNRIIIRDVKGKVYN
ncbi:hypothetical protein [Virgibacillus pantothenticus]|uniref:hypothetical protein n=1 Tax=Virgibacillus pantothenticus TaxID=1473 RepID=UPI002014E61F|nr:hypothetical protein [Virgibacillus pantothenticus]